MSINYKPKTKGSVEFHETLYELFEKADILDVQNIILESDIVSGINTTALLEAGIAGKPVIIPYFKDLQDPKYDGYIFFRDAYDLFDIAKDVNELESIIIDRLHNPTIDEKIMEERKAYFEKYV